MSGGRCAAIACSPRAPNGARTIVDTQGRLNHPTGLAVGPDGALYVANFSIAPDVGDVLKIVP